MIKRTVKLILIFILITAAFSRCSSCIGIVPPKIQITGEKTVIERQIIGEYRELEKDAWVISSIRTTVQRTKGSNTATASDPELFSAMKIREFHYDKIRIYKDEGALGESNTGYAAYMKTDKFEKSESDKNVLLKVIDEENKARKIIFTKAIQNVKNEKPEDDSIAVLGKIFADEQADSALKNDWLQDKNGQWQRKK
jgi:hypothetical protein